MQDHILIAALVSVIAFFSVYIITPYLIRFLEKRNLTVKDFHRKGGATVPRLGGLSILIGIISSELVLFVFFPITEIIVILITTSLAFLVGLVDEVTGLKKFIWFKPLALAGAAIPILLLGTFDSNLAFPLFGSIKIPLLYLAVVVFIIPITGNTVNSIDVLNGAASGFMTIASFALATSLFILGNYEIAIACLPLGFVSLAFYKYHKFPSKIFPGNSGALVLGGMYGVIAIVGQVEIIAAIALFPAIINIFYLLSRMRRIKDREKKSKPVTITDDFKLAATNYKDAPTTLVRLILARGPLSEKQVVSIIFKLSLFSAALAIITTFMMGIRL